MSASYLISGASGFLGRHLLFTLPKEDDKYVLVRDEKAFWSQPWTAELTNITVLQGDLVNLKSDHFNMDNLDGIFHCAALVDHARENRDTVFEINVEGTKRLVELAAHYDARMVFMSTSGTVGCFNHNWEWADEQSVYETAALGDWPYYRSKQDAEKEAQSLALAQGVSLVIMRPPVLLGPGDHRYRSTGHLLRLKQGRLPFILEGSMHFTDVRDVAQALVAAMHHPSPQPIYHLPGTESSLQAFFDRCVALGAYHRKPQEVPFWLAQTIAKVCKRLGPFTFGKSKGWFPDPVVVEMANRHWGLKSRFATEDLEYLPRSSDETLQDTLLWLEQNPPPKSA